MQRVDEFLLPDHAVRTAPDPGTLLMTSLEFNSAAAAQTGEWNLAAQSRR